MNKHIITEDAALRDEIIRLHEQTQSAVLNAKSSIKDAFNITFMMGTLIEKYRLMHPHTYLSILSKHISAQDIKRYESFFHRGRKKRLENGDWQMDKEQLVLADLYEQAKNIGMRNVTPIQISPIKYAMTFHRQLSTVMQKRPIQSMEVNERKQTKDALQPLLEKFTQYYNNL